MFVILKLFSLNHLRFIKATQYIDIYIYFPREYLKEESKDKKGKEMDTSGWVLHSKERHVSHVSSERRTGQLWSFFFLDIQERNTLWQGKADEQQRELYLHIPLQTYWCWSCSPEQINRCCCEEKNGSLTLTFFVFSHFIWATFAFLIPPQEIPQQMNGSDCGMFTCKYAEYITKEKPIKFTQVIQPHNFITSVLFCYCGEKWTPFLYWIFPAQRHMPYFRRRMVWELLNRKLLWCRWVGQFST